MRKLSLALALSSALLCTQAIAMPTSPGSCPDTQRIIDEITHQSQLWYIFTEKGDNDIDALLIDNSYFDFWSSFWTFTLGPIKIDSNNTTRNTHELLNDYIRKVIPSLSGEPTPIADNVFHKWLCIYDMKGGYTAIAEYPHQQLN